ncbi:hypothetical protein PoB_002447000 [Plakobranchus ocellatus]|uniref:Uncharacterized protein n=1 Tax=Plakobranchus ocellatus TaxID=259542 RepID=A0AAV3ZS80_9GAST|nr:hypothetical protein PoB_002447000 [Plakobranchus ocellatus]
MFDYQKTENKQAWDRLAWTSRSRELEGSAVAAVVAGDVADAAAVVAAVVAGGVADAAGGGGIAGVVAGGSRLDTAQSADFSHRSRNSSLQHDFRTTEKLGRSY